MEKMTMWKLIKKKIVAKYKKLMKKKPKRRTSLSHSYDPQSYALNFDDAQNPYYRDFDLHIEPPQFRSVSSERGYDR